jgi:hypothetical protein
MADAVFGPGGSSEQQPAKAPMWKFPIPTVGGPTYYPKQTIGAIRPTDGTTVKLGDPDAEIPVVAVPVDPVLGFLASLLITRGWDKQRLSEELFRAFSLL